MIILRAFLFMGLCLGLASQAQTESGNSARLALSLDHTKDIRGLLLSPDERVLYTWDDALVRTWDVSAGKALETLTFADRPEYGERIYGVRMAARRGWAMVSHGRYLKAFDLKTGASAGVFSPSATIHQFVYDETRDRVYYVTASLSDGFAVGELNLETKTGGQRAKIGLLGKSTGRNVLPQRFEQLADGRLFFALQGEEGFAIVDPSDWRVTHRVPAGAGAERREFFAGPDNTLIATRTEGAFARVQVLGGPDFAVLREGRVTLGTNAGELTFPDPRGYDPKTGRIVLTAWRHAPVALDFATLKPLNQAPAMDGGVGMGGAVAHAPSRGEWLIADGRRVVGYDLAHRQIARRFSVEAARVARLVASPTGHEFLVADAADRWVKRVRFLPSGVQVFDASFGASGLAYAPDGGSIAHGRRVGRDVTLSERAIFPAVARRLPAAPGAGFGAQDLFYSPDGSRIGVHGVNTLTVLDLDGRTVFRADFKGAKYPFHPYGLGAISTDNRHLVAARPGTGLVAYDLSDGHELWTQKVFGERNHFFFVGSDTFGCFASRQIEYRSVATGELLFTVDFSTVGGPNGLGGSALSPDRKLFAVHSDAWVRVFDTETGEEVFTQWVFRPMTALVFLADNRTLIGAGDDQLIRLWDVADKKPLATLAVFLGNADWVLSTPDFRFDGAEAALGQLYLVKSGAALPLEAMFEKLHTPRLAASLFEGGLPAPDPVNVAELKFAPTARIELVEATRNLTVEDDVDSRTTASERVKIRVRAQARQSQVAEVRLYHNAKLVELTTRNLTVEDDDAMDDEQIKTYELSLTPGENTFRAVAINAQRTESSPVELLVSYAPKADSGAVAAASGGGLRLHVLIVGINAYKNPRHRLNYAVADATAVAGRLRERATGIFTDVRVTSLIDTQANKAGITGALRAIAAEARARCICFLLRRPRRDVGRGWGGGGFFPGALRRHAALRRGRAAGGEGGFEQRAAGVLQAHPGAEAVVPARRMPVGRGLAGGGDARRGGGKGDRAAGPQLGHALDHGVGLGAVRDRVRADRARRVHVYPARRPARQGRQWRRASDGE
jgi:WD40 repeat protein